MLTYAEYEMIHDSLSLLLSIMMEDPTTNDRQRGNVIALQSKVQAIIKQMLADDVANQGR